MLVGVGVSVEVGAAVSVVVKGGVMVGVAVGSSPPPGPQEVRRSTQARNRTRAIRIQALYSQKRSPIINTN